MNPLADDLGSPHIQRQNRAKKEKERVADLEYEAWRRDMVYRIYGPQETPMKTRRGRAL